VRDYNFQKKKFKILKKYKKYEKEVLISNEYDSLQLSKLGKVLINSIKNLTSKKLSMNILILIKKKKFKLNFIFTLKYLLFFRQIPVARVINM
jgi:hypothetical protein